jgi:hypothetical protein
MRRIVFAFVLVVCAQPAFADDPKFVFGKKDDLKDVKAVEWSATAEAGLVVTTGNSETRTITAGLKASRKDGDNKLSIEGSAAYARATVRQLNDMNGNGMIDDPSEIQSVTSTTAETFAGKLRYDRFLTEFDSLFVAALAARDLPAGKESVFGGQLGYSRRLYKSKEIEAVGELGYDFSRENLVVGEPIAIHSARLFVGYKHTLTEGTSLDTSVELLTNLNHETLPTGKDGSAFKDTRVNAKFAVVSKLAKNLSVQTAVEIHYDNRPGPLAIKNLAMGFVPEAEALDTIVKASLIYVF